VIYDTVQSQLHIFEGMRTETVLILTIYLTLASSKVFLVKVRVDPDHNRFKKPSNDYTYVDASMESKITLLNPLLDSLESHGNDYADVEGLIQYVEAADINKIIDEYEESKKLEETGVGNVNEEQRAFENINEAETNIENINEAETNIENINQAETNIENINEDEAEIENQTGLSTLDESDVESVLDEANSVLEEGSTNRRAMNEINSEGINEEEETSAVGLENNGEESEKIVDKPEYDDEVYKFNGVVDPYELEY